MNWNSGESDDTEEYQFPQQGREGRAKAASEKVLNDFCRMLSSFLWYSQVLPNAAETL